ncbi:proton channel OtopLc-like [Argiope bruennichi]|uniref:proton channel OtopLc-like n=1 Tax=Argiope bruennichi TaxID=94029 RepID=UPI0024948561|nr:proton channel OtopLc-like [Argiope bruennichi]
MSSKVMENQTSFDPRRDGNGLDKSFAEPEQYPLHELNDFRDGKTSLENISITENCPQSSRDGDVLHSLSGIYAEVLIVVTAAAVITEMLPGSLPLFYFHDYLFVYLLGIGITVFIIIHGVKLHQQVTSSKNDENDCRLSPALQKNAPEKCIADINLFFRVGTAITGGAVLVTSMMEAVSIHVSMKHCVNQLSSAQPILRCIFVLFQIHFLINPKNILNTLGCFRNLAIMHLFAANFAVWFRMMVWGIVKDWEAATHIKHNSSVPWDNALNITVHSLESDVNSKDNSTHYPAHVIHYTSNCWWRVKKSEEMDITSVQYCLQNSTAGQIWEKTDQFLFVFKTQYYFLIIGILYIIWCKCSNDYVKRSYSLFSSNNNQKIDLCSKATKGFCLGLVVFGTSIIILIIFFTVDRELIMMHSIIYCVIFGSSSVSAIFALFQVKKMYSWKSLREVQFIRLFQSIGLFAILIYGSCNVISGSLSPRRPNILLAFETISMVLNSTAQYLLIVQVSRKKIDVSNANEKPGRQSIVFLIFCNISLCILECFITWSHLRHQFIINDSEVIWTAVIRCVLPFVVFYRYHSVVTLMQAWVKAYQ